MSGKKQIFIVCVDLRYISSKEKKVNDVKNFSENKRCVGTTKNVTLNPSFPYLLEYSKGFYYKIIMNKFNSASIVHNDGWQEISIDMIHL